MPELPDVENFRQYMNSTSLHKKIKDVNVDGKKMLGKTSAANLQRHLKGSMFTSTRRYGKYLFTEISNKNWLLLHFGMTGYLKYYKNEEEKPGHIRLLVNFSNGFNLAFDCRRKLGKIDLVNDVSEYIKKKKLGIDPLEDGLNLQKFRELFEKKTGAVKNALMDQNTIAGIGNVYSDEILFQAGIHPVSKTDKLNDNDIKIIYRNLNSVLKKAISKNADPEKLPKKYLLLHRKPEEDCPKCSGKIKKQTIGGRSAYFCNKHQKKK